jgi:predicted aldo/keto reductase-like oxidoreductase
MKQDKSLDRRSFLKLLGVGGAAAVAACAGKKSSDASVDNYKNQVEPPTGQMTFRTNPNTGDQVSLLGYGMMRLPMKEGTEEFDQELINYQIDYAIEHGVNYFDTSPVYCRGESERCTGIALKAQSRLPRDKYFVATKLSNFSPDSQTTEGAKKMYYESMKELQVDYIDYYLLHAVGGSMEEFNKRYVDNGIMDFLVEERKAGRIRNLGFSFHGRQEVFDEVLTLQDKYHWDFVQIELNWLDWNYANEINDGNVDASYLYAELHRLGIPAVIMEPLLGGRLAKVPQYVVNELKQMNPEKSIASWAFRYAGTPEGVLTVLSGMTFTEHLKDNLLSYCPLAPLTKEEQEKLDTKIAHQMMEEETIPCNACQYCMPCPYGIDIPTIFTHYNKMKIEGRLPLDAGDPQYRENRRRYLISLDREVERERQPDHCIKCGRCIHEKHCPQQIRIPEELDRISRFIEELKRS